LSREGWLCVAVMCTAWFGGRAWSGDGRGAELTSRRLIGRAYYENDDFARAADEFRHCIGFAPDVALDYFNLGLVLMRMQDYEGALQSLEAAQERDPDLLGVYYVQGIIYKREGRSADAVTALRQVIARDPQCRGAYYNLGVCYKSLEKFTDAIESFQKAAALKADDPSTQYQLITLYRRIGDVENAARHTEIYERVKGTVDETEKTAEALERSPYTYILLGASSVGELKPKLGSGARFTNAKAGAGLAMAGASQRRAREVMSRDTYDAERMRARYVPEIGGAVALGDYDGDGDLDIYSVAGDGRSPNGLFRNDGHGHFECAARSAVVAQVGFGMDAIFGDYDNDGQNDLYVVNCGPNVLYHNKGTGVFEDVSRAARTDEPHFGRQAVWIDYDHDNDLDLLIANELDFSEPPDSNDIWPPLGFGGEPNALLRNNGNGTFTDQTDESGLLTGLAQSLGVVAADFDEDHDTDLFIYYANASARLFLNGRMGKFTAGGLFTPALGPRARAAAEGDFDHDGHLDLVVADNGQLLLYVNDGHASFKGAPLPLPQETGMDDITRIAVLDYNNDGWSDLLLVRAGEAGLGLLAGAGRGEFRAVTAPGLAGGDVRDVAVGDMDGDGDEDIVLRSGDRDWFYLRNDEQKQNHWLDVHLVGKKVNRSGYGATVEIAAGGHYQRQTYQKGGVHFGLGDLTSVDVVRVTWPNGIAQNVIQPPGDQLLTIEEFVKTSASCAFLYAHNGTGWELVNEILGIGPLGAPLGPDVYYPVDCTELTRIRADQLAIHDGMYELRLTEELREVTYVDQIALRVVDHPVELEVLPNEMFTAPPFPEDKFFAVADARPPASAVDDRGQDVLELIRAHDGRYPTFPLTRYDGLAEPHAVTLDLGDLSGVAEVLLFLDGWIYWAEASVTMQISQDPRYEVTPLALQVSDAAGTWHTVIDSVGLPTSKGMAVPVELTGRFLCADHRVRLATNMCVYFDRIFVATRDEAARCRPTELPVASADLHFRGFSRMTRDGLGYEHFDYAAVSPIGSWDPLPGLYTRYGDVTPLLLRPDDMYVIFGAGDELTLRFDGRALPELPANWQRDFVFYANGWVKDGDLNTKYSEAVTPLPFHGMSGYPYRADEHYPDDAAHRQYLREYNTRPARATVGTLTPGATERP
jgi:hypothetical protein